MSIDGTLNIPIRAADVVPASRGATGRPAIDCGDLGMRIARDGTWWHEGAPILRHSLVKLFSGVLRREADGSHWLVTPAERGRIEVEDAAFIGVEVEVAGEGAHRRVRLRTNVDIWVEIGPSHVLRVDDRDGGPVPYVDVRAGLEARLERSVFYELVDLALADAGEDDGELALWSGGVRFVLGRTAG